MSMKAIQIGRTAVVIFGLISKRSQVVVLAGGLMIRLVACNQLVASNYHLAFVGVFTNKLYPLHHSDSKM